LTGLIDDRKHIELAEFKFSRHREAIVHTNVLTGGIPAHSPGIGGDAAIANP
jgi:hypothetical protein